MLKSRLFLKCLKKSKLFCLFVFTILFYLNVQNSLKLDSISNKNRLINISLVNNAINNKNVSLFSDTIKNIKIQPYCKCHNFSLKLKQHPNDENKLNVIRLGNSSYYLHSIKKSVLDSSQLISCDYFHSFRHKSGQKIISYSLYGRRARYYSNLELIVNQTRKFYPDWIIRVYYDQSIDKSLICKFECFYDNIEFCEINKLDSFKKYFGMYWRWLPLGDKLVDYIMSRDLDSWITQREFDAVNQWIKSNKPFHIMRDHPLHYFPILGGLWGMASVRNRTISELIFKKFQDPFIIRPYNNKLYLEDQYFLINHVWPLVEKYSLIQDSYFCKEFGGFPFPTRRPSSDCFVSCSDCCLKPQQNISVSHISTKSVGKECPQECRLKKDWNFC